MLIAYPLGDTVAILRHPGAYRLVYCEATEKLWRIWPDMEIPVGFTEIGGVYNGNGLLFDRYQAYPRYRKGQLTI